MDRWRPYSSKLDRNIRICLWLRHICFASPQTRNAILHRIWQRKRFVSVVKHFQKFRLAFERVHCVFFFRSRKWFRSPSILFKYWQYEFNLNVGKNNKQPSKLPFITHLPRRKMITVIRPLNLRRAALSLGSTRKLRPRNNSNWISRRISNRTEKANYRNRWALSTHLKSTHRACARRKYNLEAINQIRFRSINGHCSSNGLCCCTINSEWISGNHNKYRN